MRYFEFIAKSLLIVGFLFVLSAAFSHFSVTQLCCGTVSIPPFGESAA